MPCHSFIAFDLRNHGESSSHAFPLDLNSVAQDIVLALKKLNIEPKAIMGHSYGSKIALLAAKEILSVQALLMLDASPAPIIVRPMIPQEPKDALEIIEILINIEWPLSSRDEFLAVLRQEKVSEKIARWMCTNLEKRPDGYYLIFDPRETKGMLLNFIEYDAWEDIKTVAKNSSIYLLAAEYGYRLSESDKINLEKIAKQNGHFITIKDSGHIIHIDNPLGLIKVLQEIL